METLDTRQLRTPAGVDELGEFDAGETVRQQTAASKLAFELLAAEGELGTHTVDARRRRSLPEGPGVSDVCRVMVSGDDQVEATFEERAVPRQAPQEGHVIASQLGQIIGQMATPLLQVT